MSGSSGGGYPSINQIDEYSSCENLVINTHLASPQANVITHLRRGDRLKIEAVTDQGPIQAVTSNNEVAGNIISREQLRLLTCINNGTTYEAEVLSINNGQCSVQIKAV